jgi:hypothetical protein
MFRDDLTGKIQEPRYIALQKLELAFGETL